MKYRIAKRCDLDHIVDLHLKVREVYDIGFFSKMGRSFLKKYYQINIDDPNEIILCAESDNGTICGFCSGSLDVAKQTANFKRHKILLAFSAIPSIICHPSLIQELWRRYRFSLGQTDEQYIITEGARSEYWTWDKTINDPIASVELLNTLYKLFYILGVKEVFFEVDVINKRIVNFHKWNGAELINEIILPDGRRRLIMKYNLENKFN